MASDTDAQLNAGHATGGTQSKIVPLGQSQQSSNKWMGVKDYVESGTAASREQMTYGGDNKKTGVLFKGKSMGPVRTEANSGNGEKMSTNGDILKGFGPALGTVSSREQMLKYAGGDAKGKLVGKGAGATKSSSGSDQLVGGKVYPGLDLLQGTSGSQANLARAKKGLGSGKGSNKTNE